MHKLDYLIVSWGRFVLLKLILSIASTTSYRFCLVFSLSFVSKHIFISLLISSVVCLFFRSMLFSLHLFVFFIVFFFFCSWCVILWSCGHRRCLKLFHFLKIYQGLICGAVCDLSWRVFHMHLRKKWNVLFLDEMPCRYQLGLTGPMYHLEPVFPY